MNDGGRDGGGNGRPMIEWAVGAVSAALVICLVGYLVQQAVSGDGRPADLRVSIEHVLQHGGTTTVAVAVSNGGDEAAAAVRVIAAGPDEAVAREIEFDYIAAHAVRRGAFVFPGAVGENDLRVEIGGYVEP